MRITNSTEYAVRAVIEMARDTSKLYTATELSPVIDAPLRFLSKILQKLAGKNILKSARGVKGGFSVKMPLEELTLLNIVEAVDGPMALNKCLITGYECNREKQCPIHPIWEEGQQTLKSVLSRKNFKEIMTELAVIEKK